MTDKKNILIVEDFDDSRKLLALCIRRLGHDVSEATDGIEALKQAATLHPDLIIMDLSMPRMDGLEATARLKADPRTRDIPIVVSTAHSRKSQIDHALESGAIEVLIKPINISALGEMLGRYLRAKEMIAAPTATNTKDPNLLEL